MSGPGRNIPKIAFHVVLHVVLHAYLYKTCVPFIGYPPSMLIWIGGNDLARTGNWVWTPGKPIEGYENYAPNANSKPGHCLDLKLDGKYEWQKSPCNGKGIEHAFIAKAG